MTTVARHAGMNDLPKKYGSLTLVRKLGESSYIETYEGHLAEGGRVLVRRVLPALLQAPGHREWIETRIRDLMGVRHPFLVPVADLLTPDGECLMVEQWVEALPVSTIVSWCRQHGVGVPHNVFLNLSTQVCNGLEALHGRPGKASASPNVLHMALRPSTLFVNLDGRILLGGYGLTPAPSLPADESDTRVHPSWVSHLAPEQTEPDQKLIPASDIFGLATLLFELLTLQPLFEAETAHQTLQRLRRAEITTQLLGVKDVMPGLDKVLYRALSSSPRHRYQRAFVLREDLRGLMAGYSFANIADDTRRFLEPILADHPFPAPTPLTAVAAPAPGPADAFDDNISTRVDNDPRSTAAFASQALAERAAREHKAAPPEAPPMPTSFPPPPGQRQAPPQPASTEAYIAQARGEPIQSAGPTILPPDPQPLPEPTPPPMQQPPVQQPPSQQPSAPPPQAMSLEQKPVVENTAVRTASRSASLAAAAPPPGRSAAPEAASPAPVSPPPVVPPPQASPAPSPVDQQQYASPQAQAFEAPAASAGTDFGDHEEDTGDWEPPAKRGKTMFLLLVAGLVIVLVCSGGLYAAWTTFGAAWVAGTNELAELDIPEMPADAPPVEPPEESPGLDAVADAQPAQPPPQELPEPEEPVVPAAAGARDQPAYQGGGERSTTSRSTTSRSSSTGNSSGRGTGSSSRSSSGSSNDYASTSRSSTSSNTSRSSGNTSRSSTSSSTSRSSSGGSSDYGSSTSRSSSSYGSSSGHTASSASYEPAVADLGTSESSSSDPEDSNNLLERYSAQAATGSLSSSDIMVIEMVQPEDSAFTRSRLMLVMNAKAKSDAAAVKRYLDELSLRPENQYNPVVLAEYARYYVNKRDYQRALDKAVLAERHWARLPPELVFAKKAEIYEVEAASYQGLFYKSEDNLDLLEKSIRHWQKYRQHVLTESRTDLQSRADREIEKLENIRERLQ
jgi:hypothetical protein